MKCLEVNFRQCTYCLQNLGITYIAYSFSPLREMPDIFRHFMKCLTSRIACNIYIYIFQEALTKYNETHQVQLLPPTRADELPFVDARFCKPSLNSSITPRHSRSGNQKRWNNPRSLCTCPVDLFRHQSLRVRLCTCTEPVFWRPSWISYQTAVNKEQLVNK